MAYLTSYVLNLLGNSSKTADDNMYIFILFWTCENVGTRYSSSESGGGADAPHKNLVKTEAKDSSNTGAS